MLVSIAKRLAFLISLAQRLAPLVALTTALLSVTACSKSNNEDAYTEAPYLDFECSFADALGCLGENSGKTVFIGLDADLDSNCVEKLSPLIPEHSFDELGNDFDYSSKAQASLNGGVLTGLATHWVNSHLMPVYSMEQMTFKVCAFIDLNNNEALDPNEPIHESLLNPATAFLPLSNWTDY